MTDEVIDSEVTPVMDAAVAEPEQEKTLPVSRVEELVKKAKLKGRDSMQAELDAARAENAQLKQNQASMGGMAVPLDPEALKAQILGELKQQFQQAKETEAAQEMDAHAKRIADEYRHKMKSGAEKYEDFDDVMADFNPQAFPNLVYLANEVDNTPDVMRELMQNPSKWATVTVLSERDPVAARNMINRISNSIKTNEQAKAQEKEVAPPLSRLSSTSTGTDAGALTMQDMKRMFRG